MHDVSRGSGPTGALLYRLELSYKGHQTTFIGKICWKEQILPRNLLNLGKASLFPYPLFPILNRPARV